jgi:glycosyltransferase involved in cell wall biosynthesis
VPTCGPDRFLYGSPVPRSEQVTVVIPCFNYGRYVGEAVRSALEQSGGPPHVIVVDDGSTEPETASAIDALPDEVERVRIPNSGPAGARNAGAERTRTPFLLALDADDRLAPGALDTLTSALDAAPDAAYSYGVMRMFGDVTGEVRFPDFDPYRLLYRPIVGSPGALLVRTEAFREVGGYDPDVPGYEDWDFQLALLERGWGAVRVPEVTLEYRKHGRSGLSVDRDRHLAVFRALKDKHPDLYGRSGELARESDLGRAGRLAYRTWWVHRPLPARVERRLYELAFRLRS